MPKSTNNFDLSEALGDLTNFARERITNLLGSSADQKPDLRDVKNAVLSVLDSDTKNAHEILRAISLASAGSWQPSSGDVHTALNELVAEAMVSVSTASDRKVYSATKKGRKALQEALSNHGENTDASAPKDSKKSISWTLCDPQFLVAASKLGPVLLDIGQTGSAQQQKQASAALDRLRHELHVILADDQ